jgi:transaldolase
MRTADSGDTAGALLRELAAEGVSPWLDGIDRDLIAAGRFARLVEETGILGATSNPAQLAKAVADERSAYRGQLTALARRRVDADSAIGALLLHDARLAGDELRGVFSGTGGHDGHVSIDLDPGLADDAVAMVAVATELFVELDRPNAMVKIPATDEGLVAIRECLAKGIGVHAAEVFSVHRYRQVVHAYFEGLAEAKSAGLDLAMIASVASLPVGVFDAEVDARLAEHESADARALVGTGALANARLMYCAYDERLGSQRWRGLQADGARPQRLMWTSSGAEHVDRIVGWGTVTAMSLSAIESVTRHGELRGDTLTGECAAAQSIVDGLGLLGISYDAVVRTLERDSRSRLDRSWQELRSATRKRLRTVDGVGA